MARLRMVSKLFERVVVDYVICYFRFWQVASPLKDILL